jgi:methyl-accepting chemotaxis protein
MTAVVGSQAGKARAGFAVMAVEVRTLASRTADAAKNTSNPMEISIKAVKKRHDPDPIAPERFQG